MTANWFNDLCCPKCQARLSSSETGLLCRSCHLQIPVMHDIPAFPLAEMELSEDFDQRTQDVGDSALAYMTSNHPLARLASLYNHDLICRSLKRSVRLENCTILEIGCGTGGATEFLLNNNTVYGLDLSITMLRFAAKRGFRTVRASVKQRLPFPNSFFDGVLCLGVLPYIEENEIPSMMQEIARVTKRGGSLYMASPSPSVPRMIFRRMVPNKNKILVRRMYGQHEIVPLIRDFADLREVYSLYPFPPRIRRDSRARHRIFSTNWIARFTVK